LFGEKELGEPDWLGPAITKEASASNDS